METEQLWLHRAIVGKFVADPVAVRGAGATNLRRLRRLHPTGRPWEWIDRWQAALDDGPEAVLETLTSSAEYAVELRGNSPFAGVLSEVERRAVLDALAAARRQRARSMRAETLERVLRVV